MLYGFCRCRLRICTPFSKTNRLKCFNVFHLHYFFASVAKHSFASASKCWAFSNHSFFSFGLYQKLSICKWIEHLIIFELTCSFPKYWATEIEFWASNKSFNSIAFFEVFNEPSTFQQKNYLKYKEKQVYSKLVCFWAYGISYFLVSLFICLFFTFFNWSKCFSCLFSANAWYF